MLARSLVGLLALLAASCSSYQKAELSSDLESKLKASNSGTIPLQDFFKDAEFGAPVISPDGKHLAVTFPQDGKDSVAIMDINLEKLIYTAKFVEDRHIMAVEWINNKRLMILAGKKYGTWDGRNSELRPYFFDYDGKNFKDFFSQEAAHYQMVRKLPNEPDFIVMAKYHGRDRGRPTAIKLNINNGRTTLLNQPPIERGGFLADEKGFVNVGVESSDKDYDKTEIHYRLDESAPWSKLDYPAKSKYGTVSPIQLDAKNKVLYVTSSHETNRQAVYKLNLTTGKTELVSGDAKVDVQDVIMDKDKLVGVTYQPDYVEFDVIDKDNLKMQLYQKLAEAFPKKTVGRLNLSDDQSVAVFAVYSDTSPGEFYKMDVKGNKVTKLGDSRSWIKPEQMAEMKPIAFKARDGLDISAYLTTPKGKEAKNLPAVLVVHGGPHGVRDNWGFDPEAQFLSSRGFAVLQVNYRGSGGYGDNFLRAGYRQWGLAMQDDLTDATQWLIKQGIADPKKICIYGASYGGYAALMGVVREPDLYRCSVTYVGVSDLTIQQNDSDTVGSQAGEKYVREAIGEDKADLMARSALYNVDKIKVPVFIAHGKDDKRVPYSNAERLKEAFDKAGKPYVWLAKDSEGHGFTQLPNRFEFYLTLEQFLKANTN